jgi:hypothetical protein
MRALLPLVAVASLIPAAAAAQVSARIHIGGPIGAWVHIGDPYPPVRVVYRVPRREVVIVDRHPGPRVIVVHGKKHRHDRQCRHADFHREIVYFDRDHDRYYDADRDRHQRGRRWKRVEVYRHEGRYYRHR